MKTVKAILIDAENREVRTVEINDYTEMAPLIKCRMFTTATYLNDTDCVFVDDEGLLTNPQCFFSIGETTRPYAGNGLVVGTDSEGESATPALTQRLIEALVTFHSLSEVRQWSQRNPEE